MTATQEKLYNELSTDVINDDDSAAKELYAKYEKLPLVEQLALGFTPVVGETISAYETPIFARETKTVPLMIANRPRVCIVVCITLISTSLYF